MQYIYTPTLLEPHPVQGGSRPMLEMLKRGPDGKPQKVLADPNTAETTAYLKKVFPALKAHLDAKGWTNKFYMSALDEPTEAAQVTAATWFYDIYTTYFPDPLTNEAHGYTFLPGAAENITTFTPYTENYEDHTGYWQDQRLKGKELWLYVCIVPWDYQVNRLIGMHLAKSRLLPWLVWKIGGKGFQHWGWNYWAYKPDSEFRGYDTFDGPQNGDSYIVRPDKGRYDVYDSVRSETQLDGAEDYELLNQLAAVIAETHGWRIAFFVVGVPGILLALFALRLEEPPRGPRSEVIPLMKLLSVPAYVALIASGIMITFTSVSFIFWGPDFATTWKGFSQAEAGISLGFTVLSASLLGVLAGGYVADWSQKRFHYGRILTVAVAFLVAAPFVLWALQAEQKEWVIAALFIASFFMSWYHGPVTAVIHDLMPRRAHATSLGVYMFVTQLVGGVMGPVVVGRIDDRATLLLGLQVAVGVMVLGALCMFLVIYFIRRQGLRHPEMEIYRTEADS